MVNEKISIHDRNLEGRKHSLEKWKIPDKEKKRTFDILE